MDTVADKQERLKTRIMSSPFLTIIIPTLQAERTLGEALDSVLVQQFGDWELLIMDSVSRDRTLEIAGAYAQRDPRVRIISEPDKGIYDAMNKGIDAARGEWILFLGSDDRLQDERVLSVFAGTPGLETLDMVYGNVVSPSYKGVYDGEFDLRKLLRRNMPHQAIFHKRSLFASLGGYTIHYRGYADWDLNIRCFKDSGVRKQYIDLVVAYFGADGVSSRHDVLFLLEVMVPEQLRLLAEEPRLLRSVTTFDEWWRLLRNAGIRDRSSLEEHARGLAVPRPLVRMVRWQQRVPVKWLRVGPLSKTLMFVNYLSNWLTASL
jgi:glycosyltransferase involved in cell wall biosynthesis